MTTITEGMTTAAFILAMNANFSELKYEATTITQLTEKTAMSVIGDNFANIESETISAPLIEEITAGISGADFNTRVNGNQNRYYSDSMTFSVGVGKNFTTINNAITRSITGNTIVIDEGTFAERLNLTTKRLNLIGSGTLGTIIYYYENGNAANHYYTLDIGQNCTFDNLLIRKKSNNQTGNNVQIVNVAACSPVFTDCKILLEAADFIGDISAAKFGALKISTGANLTFSGIIDCFANTTLTSNIIISDTSTFIFNGSKFKSRILTEDTSVTSITTDNFYIGTEYAAVTCTDASVLTLNNTLQTGYNTVTDAAASAYSNILFVANLFNTCTFTLLGDIKGQVKIDDGTDVTLNLTNVTGNQGRLWITTPGTVANSNKITLSNCNIFFDYNDKVSGFHILEDNQSSEWEILDSTLEFSGYTGIHETMGNPIVMYGENAKITIKRSTIIDNVNDGNNYLSTIWAKNIFDFEDVIITNRNWDEVAASRNLVIAKAAGQHINGRLVNVTFNNSCNVAPINFVSAGQSLDENDYIIAQNVVNNSTEGIFAIDGTENLAAWNTLLSNAPV